MTYCYLTSLARIPLRAVHPTSPPQGNLKELRFEPTKLGLKYKRGVVTAATPGSQADMKGVQVGWEIKILNGMAVPAEIPAESIKDAIASAIDANKPVIIVFDTNPALPPPPAASKRWAGKVTGISGTNSERFYINPKIEFWRSSGVTPAMIQVH